MKLTKENIYINLQGKSKEELTDLWEFLNSNGEKCYRDKDYFIEYQSTYRTLYLYCNLWRGYDDDKIYYKTEVTIQQLKQIIKPMETFTPIAMKCTQEQFEDIKPKLKEIGKIGDLLFAFENDNLYLVNNYNGEKLYFDISYCGDFNRKVYEQWNEEIFLKACGIEVETLQQRLKKAEAEVKRLKEAIEDSEIKVGDWVKRTREGLELFKADKTHDYRYINSEKHLYQKITDQELINKLNELIK